MGSALVQRIGKPRLRHITSRSSSRSSRQAGSVSKGPEPAQQSSSICCSHIAVAASMTMHKHNTSLRFNTKHASANGVMNDGTQARSGKQTQHTANQQCAGIACIERKKPSEAVHQAKTTGEGRGGGAAATCVFVSMCAL